MNLSAFNLNHLVALELLLRERNVGRAATRAGVTQSAMSHTLRILRDTLNDPLLVRVGNGMVLTPFAEETRGRLRRGLGELEGVLSGRAGFDPATVDTTFTLATNDGAAALTAAPLLSALRDHAPGAKLRIHYVAPEQLADQLEDGRVDVAMVPPFLKIPGTVGEALPGRGTSLATMSVVSRQGHPDIGKRLTLARYCRLEHAMASVSGEGPSFVDHLLAEKNRTREVVLRVPYMVALVEAVANTDVVATTITAVAQFFCERWPVQMHPLPLSFDAPDMELRWHPRFDADPSHRFFRNLVRRTADALAAKY